MGKDISKDLKKIMLYFKVQNGGIGKEKKNKEKELNEIDLKKKYQPSNETGCLGIPKKSHIFLA